MPTWLLLGLLATTPPLVPADAPLAPPPTRGFSVAPRPAPTPEAPPVVGVYFAPMSLFSLSLYAEVDVPLAGGLDVFAVIGGGFLGQLGFEAGLRYYGLGRSLEGFYVDARASGFAMPAWSFVMLAPGLQLGHAWRVKSFVMSIGAGFSTWWTVSRGAPQNFLFGTPTNDEVIAFPGVQVPAGNGPSVQPTMRVAIGFAL